MSIKSSTRYASAHAWNEASPTITESVDVQIKYFVESEEAGVITFNTQYAVNGSGEQLKEFTADPATTITKQKVTYCKERERILLEAHFSTKTIHGEISGELCINAREAGSTLIVVHMILPAEMMTEGVAVLTSEYENGTVTNTSVTMYGQ